MSLHKAQFWLSGDVFRDEKWRKQYKWLGMVAILVFIYILDGYHAEAQQHRIVELDQEIEDAKIEWLTTNAELSQRLRQSYLVNQLKELNSPLEANKEPLVYIP